MFFFRFVGLAFRQHFLERLKSPLLLILIAVVWSAAAFPNSLGTSSLFWLRGYLAYGQTCLALGLLCAAWAWVSLLVDTGKEWLITPTPMRALQVFGTRNWPALPSFRPKDVFAYLAVSTFLLSLAFGCSHACHVLLVPLPARKMTAFPAFLMTSGSVFLGSLVGILFLRIASVWTSAPVVGTGTKWVRTDMAKLAADSRISGYDYSVPDDFVWLHETAFIAGLLGGTLLTALVLPSWFLDYHWGGASLNLCVLVMLLSFAVGFALYRRRTGTAWFGLLAAVTLAVVFVAATSPEHRIRGLSPIEQRANLVQGLQSAIEKAKAKDKAKKAQEVKGSAEVVPLTPADSNEEEPKRPLVVIGVSGGGIRAQIWALATLCALDHTLPGFNNDSQLVTGASGGMVGATHYVASLKKPGDIGDQQVYGELIRDASRDALTRTFAAHVINDMLGAFPRKIARGLGCDIIDRGRVLENEWIRHTRRGEESVFEWPLAKLKASEKSLSFAQEAGWRPVLLFSPTIAEDGRRLIICNQRVDDLVANFATSATASTDEAEILSVDSLHLEDIDPGGHTGLTLATAARLNANFPIVVASPELANARALSGDTKAARPLHVMDGGYYDNYGINLAARWLSVHANEIKQKYSGVLFLQIVSANRYRAEIGGTSSGFPEASYINVGFQKTTFLTDFQIHHLSKTFSDRTLPKQDDDSRPRPYFTFCSLEFDGPVSLNWSLTPSELYALLLPYVRMTNSPFSAFPDGLSELDDLQEEFGDGKAIFEARYPELVKSGADGTSELETDEKPRTGSLELQATIDRINDQFLELETWWRAAHSAENN